MTATWNSSQDPIIDAQLRISKGRHCCTKTVILGRPNGPPMVKVWVVCTFYGWYLTFITRLRLTTSSKKWNRESGYCETHHKCKRALIMSSGTGIAFKLSSRIAKRSLITKGTQETPKVVTSGGEVITSGPKNCVKKEISTVGIKVKLGNVHENQRYSKPSISNT